MNQFNGSYLVNEKGKRVGVLLDIAQYEKILDELEELESIRAYDAAKAAKDEAIPLDGALSPHFPDQPRGSVVIR